MYMYWLWMLWLGVRVYSSACLASPASSRRHAGGSPPDLVITSRCCSSPHHSAHTRTHSSRCLHISTTRYHGYITET